MQRIRRLNKDHQRLNDDLAAIERCLAGDTDMFQTLVELYEREAVSHALAIVRNHEDALDVVQEAFVDAYRALKQFDPQRQFYPWFYVILRNRCFKLLEQRKRRPDGVNVDSAGITIVRSEASPERMGELNDALAMLSAADREIILLKHIDGLTCRELARRLEIPIGTVMSRLYYARLRLRDALTK